MIKLYTILLNFYGHILSKQAIIYSNSRVATYCVKNLSPDRFWSKVLAGETCSTKRTT